MCPANPVVTVPTDGEKRWELAEATRKAWEELRDQDVRRTTSETTAHRDAVNKLKSSWTRAKFEAQKSHPDTPQELRGGAPMATQAELIQALQVAKEHIEETVTIGLQYHESISETVNQIAATIDVGYTPLASAMLLSAMESFQEVQRIVQGAATEVGNMITMASGIGQG